jgi:transcriptional regulator with XRE-family HTH domain
VPLCTRSWRRGRGTSSISGAWREAPSPGVLLEVFAAHEGAAIITLSVGESQVIQIKPHSLGARIREARESHGWTQEQLAEHLKMARTTIVAIEKGERRLKPSEIIQISSFLGRSVSDLLQRGMPSEDSAPHSEAQRLLGLSSSPTDDEVACAVVAWQCGELSEGQLARLLRTDRLGAREKVRFWASFVQNENEEAEPY